MLGIRMMYRNISQYKGSWYFTYIWCDLGLTTSVEALTHSDRDEIDAIVLATFSNTFCCMEMIEYRLEFH